MLRVLVVSVLTGLVFAQASAPLPTSAEARSPNAVSSACTLNSTNPPIVAPEAVPRIDSPLPDIPPLPRGKTTLVGGKVAHVDHVRDRLELETFGGKRFIILFDERTRVFRDGLQATLDDLKDDNHAYVDTTLDGKDIFARNIRVFSAARMGESKGQIVSFDAGTRELKFHDGLSSESVRMRLAADAEIARTDSPSVPANLRPGALVVLVFTSGGRGLPVVHKVSIIAAPGATFLFSGRVAYFDMHRGLLVLNDPRDNQSYEISFDPRARHLTQDLRQDADLSVQAYFDGTHYQARAITVNPPPGK